MASCQFVAAEDVTQQISLPANTDKVMQKYKNIRIWGLTSYWDNATDDPGIYMRP